MSQELEQRAAEIMQRIEGKRRPQIISTAILGLMRTIVHLSPKDARMVLESLSPEEKSGIVHTMTGIPDRRIIDDFIDWLRDREE